MYRVAIIVNENETLHSVYANTEFIIKKALSKVYLNGGVDRMYSFETFDKFNISTLFEKGNNNIFTFDSIFIATNACNNIEIYNELVENKGIIAQYIDDANGNCHGMCISNQQKLGAVEGDAHYIEFLADLFTYKLIKRKEKKSSDGTVTIYDSKDWLVNFPIKIDNTIIERCCSGEKNQFMPHKYRYILSPNIKSSYDIIYEDKSYSKVETNDSRSLLLKSRVGNERLIISSVVLDWSEHLEQLANILIYITEGINQVAFIYKSFAINKRFSRYINKAHDQKMALKQYNENEILEVLNSIKQEGNGLTTQLYPHSIFVFSSEWLENEINDFWEKYVIDIKKDIVFYRIVDGDSNRKNELTLVSSFSKSVKNSYIFLSAEEWLMANYTTSQWRKSIWTYEYILRLFDYLSFNATGYIIPLYNEIISHYKIKESDSELKATNSYLDFTKLRNPELFENLTYQTYDNVFNSTCSCCNVLDKLYLLCNNNNINEVVVDNQKINTSVLLEERTKCGNWILYKLNSIEYSQRISWQDRIMAFVALYDSGYIINIENNNIALFELLKNELKNCTSIFDRILLTVDRNTYKVDSAIALIDLCKILQFLYVVNEILPSSLECEKFAIAVEKKLFDEQSYNGAWKNLSKTSEISVALLSRLKYNWKHKNSEYFEVMINRAVNFIQNNFDYDKTCWLNDENTTAKSLSAILLYDKVYDFAFDDFLVDLINSANRTNPIFSVSNNIKALDFAQSQYNQLISEKQKSDLQVREIKKNKHYLLKLIKRYKLIVGFTATMAALAILFSICLIGIFSTTYPKEWQTILNDNITKILATVLGLVVTTILTGVVQHTKTKLIEDYNKEELKL